jgi:dipeptidyl aminopeptidase/acylaminoacyl peptidase
MDCQMQAAGRAVLVVALLTAAVGALSSDPQHRQKPQPALAYTVTHTVLNRYPLGKGEDVADIQWSPDGRKLAVAREDGQAVLLPDRKTLWADSKKTWGGTRLWWSPDGRQLALLRQGTLEILTVNTGHWQRIGDGIFSVAWLPTRRPGSPTSIVGELVCVKYAGPNDDIIIARLSTGGRGSRRCSFRRIHVSKSVVPTALSPDGRVLIVGLPQKGSDYDDAALSVWHPRFPEGTIQWNRRLGFYWEYKAYARAVWSEPLQAAAVSFPGATDGASLRRLVVVTRTREIYYQAPQYDLSASLLSDPVWLGNRVIFAEGGWDNFEAPNRKCTYVISSLEVPRGSHEVLFAGADDYRAPAVSPDNRRLAYAEKRRGSWEVVIVAIDESRLLARASSSAAARATGTAPTPRKRVRLWRTDSWSLGLLTLAGHRLAPLGSRRNP